MNTVKTPALSACTTDERFLRPHHTAGCCRVTGAGRWSGQSYRLAYEKPAAAAVTDAEPVVAAAAVVWLW